MSRAVGALMKVTVKTYFSSWDVVVILGPTPAKSILAAIAKEIWELRKTEIVRIASENAYFPIQTSDYKLYYTDDLADSIRYLTSPQYEGNEVTHFISALWRLDPEYAWFNEEGTRPLFNRCDIFPMNRDLAIAYHNDVSNGLIPYQDRPIINKHFFQV